jgi:uncharacterized protein YdbL (DUF1318 family)
MIGRTLCVCLALLALAPVSQAAADTKTAKPAQKVGPVAKDYEASIMVDGKTVIDTCRATGPAEARKLFTARWPKGRVGYVREL